MTILVPLLAALVGLVVYVLATNGKAAELGRILYAMGALATLLSLAHANIRVLP